MTLEQFLTNRPEDIAVRFENIEEEREFLERAEELDIRWINNNKATQYIPDCKYDDYVCIVFNRGKFQWCDETWYRKGGKDIMPYKNLSKERENSILKSIFSNL